MLGSRPFLIAALFAAVMLCTAAGSPDSFRLEVRASPNATLISAKDVRFVTADKLKTSSSKLAQPLVTAPLTDLYLSSPSGTYRMDSAGALWDETHTQRYALPRSMAKKLLKQGKALRKQHYGELTDWAEARHIVPRKSTFAITDIETGLTFRVQRRAGSDHADVQPLTKEDTRIMAQIYDQGWSWRRKAIIVTAGDRRMAASMNGMPHGGDGIPGNGFDGHFCVHFLNSSTHRSEHPDLIHQLMVYKAAGSLRSYLDESSPLRLAQSLIIAIDHRDAELIRMMSEGMDTRHYNELAEQAARISSIRWNDKTTSEPDTARLLVYEADCSVSMTFVRRGSRSETLRMIFARTSFESPWRLMEVNPWTGGEKLKTTG